MKRFLPLVVSASLSLGALFWLVHMGSRHESLAPHSTPAVVSPADISAEIIRVNVTPPGNRLTVAVDGPYEIRRALGDSRVLARGSRLEAASAGASTAGLHIGNLSLPVSELEIQPARSPSIWIGDHQYRGSVRLYRRDDGNSLLAVNVLPLEAYIASVVDSEMPAEFPDEARKAQAIVSRTFALYRMRRARSDARFDVHATTQSQKYLGYQYRDSAGQRFAGESSNSRQIVQETAGKVCFDRGEMFCTYYSAVCGGRTTMGRRLFPDAADPLQSVPCEWCREAPLFRWTTHLSKSEATSRLKQYFRDAGQPFGRIEALYSSRREEDRFPQSYTASDGRHECAILVEDLRRHLPSSILPSYRFTVRNTADELIFDGRGHGHGVGMCQWGARGLALAGRSATEILSYYYPGAQVAASAETASSGPPSSIPHTTTQ